MFILLQFENESTGYLLIGLAVLTILYVVLRPMLRRRKDPLDQPPRIGLSQQRSVEREMSNVLVQLSEMSRQVSAQLDTRAARLELLIQQADERLEALNAALQQHDAPAVPPHRSPAPSGAHPPPAAPAPPDPLHLEVYQLADQGRSTQQIAERLARPSGEVELILALRSKI